MAKSNFIVRGGADFSGIKDEIDKTQNQFKKFQSTLSSGLKTFGKLTGIALGTKALIDFGKASLKVASDLEEIQNVVDVTFGAMSKDIDEFSKGLIDSFGLGELSAKKYASYMGAMLKSSGIQGDAVRKMSKDLTLLTADMASFYNLETEEMFQKLMSGMTGATMPLKQLGINMNIANLEAFALSQGIKKSWKEMSQAEQVMLRYNYLMAVTSDAQGDFARNSWNWAHSLKILNEKWQQFMGLVGAGLREVLLPLVHGLIKVMDVLIAIAEQIGKIYTMITGKQIVAETNKNIEITAGDAADSENDLAKGIDKAAKAARGALMPFDELNILQQNLGTGGSGSIGLNDINTDFGVSDVGDSIADGIRKTKEETEGFFVWFFDMWTKLKDALMIPIRIPAPIFAKLPDPIYKPNWGLELPPLKKPVFQPIPSPVYNPEWNLEPPPVPVVVFPAIDYADYHFSLEELNILTVESFAMLLEELNASFWELQTETLEVLEEVQRNVSIVLETIRVNLQLHQGNVGVITAAIAAVFATNLNRGLSSVGKNVTTVLETIQENLQTFGGNIGTATSEIAINMAHNLSEGFRVASRNFSEFANAVGENLKTFGEGFLRVSAETAQGFVDNMVSGFQTVWSNFKDLMRSIGERISKSFSANKSFVVKTAIAAGVVVGAGALALAAPATIPYVAGGLAGLASVPALAKGGITDGPMLALIGDNPGGKEVVSPLDTLQDMLVSAVGTALLQAESLNSGNKEPIIMQVILEGEEIARAVYDPLQDEKSRRGDITI